MDTVVEHVLAALPQDIILSDPDLLRKYLTDFRGQYIGHSAAVLRPRNTKEVAKCVALCAQAGIVLVPQAGNTSYCGAATPDASGRQLIISLERMSRVRDFDTLNRSITVETGIILSNLQDFVAKKGLLCPLSLGSERSCQLGGNLATNAGGLNVLRYGMARRMVLGLEVVLSDGSIVDTLAPLRKKNAGYDTDNLFIGAEGTLGIITAASLRLERQPVQTVTAFLAVSDAHILPRLLESLQTATDDSVTSFEYISEHSLSLLLSARPELRRPLDAPRRHYALFEVATSIKGLSLSEVVESVIADGFEAGEILDGTIAASESQRSALWELRESLPEGETFHGGAVKHDIAVRVSQIPHLIETATSIVWDVDPGLRLSIYGHVGDGNVHFNVLSPTPKNCRDKAWIDAQVSPRLYSLVASMGGTFSAEYGLGQEKILLAEKYSCPIHRSLMKRIKTAIDPFGILNLGKVIEPRVVAEG